MSRTPRFDWHAWRSAIAERLDRRTITAALAYVAFLATLGSLTAYRAMSVREVLFTFTVNFILVTMTLLVLAVAMVASHRGVSPWIAYPLAAFIAVPTGFAAYYVFDPYGFLPRMANPQWAPFVFLGWLLPVAGAAVGYVYQSNAAQSATALRRLATERAAEAERLANERLRGMHATIDHDLVLSAMRLARASPTDTETVLAAVSTYLRTAQQRESSDAASVTAALDELRRLCAAHPPGPTQHAA